MLKLKEVLAKKVAELSAEEKAFIVANVAEMSADEKTAFAEVLNEKTGEGMDIEAVKALVSKSVAEALAEQADKMSEQLVSKFMKGVETQRAKAIETGKKAVDEKRNVTKEFFSALMSGDMASAKALTNSTSGSSPDDAKAGLLIPSELLAEVLRVMNTQYGLARRDMRYLPFSGPGNSRTIPALGTSVSVKWTNEGAKKKSTQPKFGVVTQTLKKLTAIVPMTEEILEDSAINLTQLVSELIGEAIAMEEDLAFFAGTGSPWTGILNNSDVNQVPQASIGGASGLTADDLLDMQDATPTGAQNGAKYYLHRTVLSVIRKLKDDNGRYIYQEPAGNLPATIWNKPVEVSDAFPALADIEEGDAYVLYGNLKQGAVFGDKQQIRTKLLSEATITDTDDSTPINLAEQDMVALRFVERVGYVIGLPKALTVLQASAES